MAYLRSDLISFWNVENVSLEASLSLSTFFHFPLSTFTPLSSLSLSLSTFFPAILVQVSKLN